MPNSLVPNYEVVWSAVFSGFLGVFFIAVLLMGLALMVVWMVKHLRPELFMKWAIGFMVIGLAGCFLVSFLSAPRKQVLVPRNNSVTLNQNKVSNSQTQQLKPPVEPKPVR